MSTLSTIDAMRDDITQLRDEFALRLVLHNATANAYLTTDLPKSVNEATSALLDDLAGRGCTPIAVFAVVTVGDDLPVLTAMAWNSAIIRDADHAARCIATEAARACDD